MAKLALLVIHGMGDQGPDFADEMIEEIDERIGDAGQDPDDVEWHTIHWANVVGPAQRAMLRRLRNFSKPVDMGLLRKFVIHNFGDAAAYQPVSGANPVYMEVRAVVHRVISEVEDKHGNQVPVVILAHSLGAHIMSTYIWDRRTWDPAIKGGDDPFGDSQFQKLHSLSEIITFGCNIPIFTLAYQDLKMWKFPHPALPNSFDGKPVPTIGQWNNYYDRDDVLGYPMGILNGEYRNINIIDHEINVGFPIFQSPTPLSHTAYWTDNDFTVPATNRIMEVLKLL